MNALLRTTLVRSAFVASGVVAGAGGTVALSSGAHEAIRIAKGDTVSVKFSIKTDTVLKALGGARIVGRSCGNSFVYLRIWHGTVQISADSVATEVSCGTVPVDTIKPDTTPVSTLDACFIPTDSAAKYGIRGDVTLDSTQVALIQPWCKTVDTLHVDPTMMPVKAPIKIALAPKKPHPDPSPPTVTITGVCWTASDTAELRRIRADTSSGYTVPRCSSDTLTLPSKKG